jgi:SAM-dependent methyltransferase
VYNVNDDSQLKMGDYFDLAADLYGLPRPPRVPRSTAQDELPLMLLSFMSESRRLDNTRLKQELRLVLRYPTQAQGAAPAAAGGQRFLDIGCNEGFFCGYAQFAGATRVVGLDQSETFITRARQRFAGVEFLHQSWDTLPPGPFDVVLLASSLHYAQDQADLIHRAVQLLSPTGTPGAGAGRGRGRAVGLGAGGPVALTGGCSPPGPSSTRCWPRMRGSSLPKACRKRATRCHAMCCTSTPANPWPTCSCSRPATANPPSGASCSGLPGCPWSRATRCS